MKENHELVNFIREVKRRGYSNDEIIAPLLKRGWTIQEIDSAFSSLNNSEKNQQKTNKESRQGKEKVEIYLSKDIHEIVRKRSRKNMLSIPEQVEDIVRRSCASTKLKKASNEKLDDLLVGIFSRRRSGRQR